MTYKTLVDPTTLAQHLGDPAWAIIDCRFTLAEAARGCDEYAASHIPGALYAHLDDDLSAPVQRGVTGRHPLPDPAALRQRLSAWGIDAGVQVVAYDSSGGSMAVRLWWLLRWLGHDTVALLDGGWQAWLAAACPTSSASEQRPPRRFTGSPDATMVADAAEVRRMVGNAQFRVFDSRAAERYRGENETIDPVAGHIPGARSLPYAGNLAVSGRFLPPAALRQRFAAALGGVPASDAVFYCGSGVSAVHNLLALAHAGLGTARLYPGSWSEWITDPANPVASGSE